MALTPEADIRLYNAAGQRLQLPREWITEATFEIAERGGCSNGGLTITAPWEALSLTGTEYVDIRLWGQLLYRGFLLTPSTEMATTEAFKPTLYGLSERLNAFLIQRDFAYLPGTDISEIFTDLVTRYALPSDRLPNLQIDVTGISALGLTQIGTVAVSGKSLTQALNWLCDQYPDQLIWGCDVDNLGRNRCYLRQRSEDVAYTYVVGGNVEAMTYPRDVTQVVNRIVVTGGKLDNDTVYQPNIAGNGSFEETVVPGELTTNLLVNTDFSAASGANPGPPWGWIGDPTLDGTYSRTGSGAACVFDNNAFPGETIFQDTAVTEALPAHASAWLMTIVGEHWRVRLRMEYRNGSGTVLDSIVGPWIDPPADNIWRHYQLDWANPSASGATILRYILEQDASLSVGSHGLNADDCAMWIGQISAKGWKQQPGSGGGLTLLDWTSNDPVPAPRDGDAKVKLTAAITGGSGSYAEIGSTVGSRISVHTHSVYYLAAWIYVPAGGPSMDVAIGAKLYAGSTLNVTLVSPIQTITGPASGNGGWTQVQFNLTTGGSADGMDLILRFYSSATCYLDAVAVWFNSLPDWSNTDIYYPGDTFTAVRDSTEFGMLVSADAALSPSVYGWREKAVSNPNVVDLTTLDAFCVGYFNAHATPAVQGTLDIADPKAPIGQAGTVRLVNLPNAPPPLFPARVRYTVGSAIRLSCDLNNDRPDLASLLRQVVIEAI